MPETVLSILELDCPWFDPHWLTDHPDFPLAATAAEQIISEEE